MGRGRGRGAREDALIDARRYEKTRVYAQAVIEEFTPLWDAATSADPENWSSDNPSYGQCAVTSMVIQDRFGGDLLRTTVDGVSHYFNRLPSGQEVDATFDQFGPEARYGEDPVVRERSYVEGHQATVERYRKLKTRYERNRLGWTGPEAAARGAIDVMAEGMEALYRTGESEYSKKLLNARDRLQLALAGSPPNGWKGLERELQEIEPVLSRAGAALARDRRNGNRVTEEKLRTAADLLHYGLDEEA